MSMLHLLAEQRIEEAMRDGAFDDLPGAGKPLELADDRLVPEESRAAYRLLKNAGFVPPELETRREMADLQRLLATVSEDETPNGRDAHRDLLRDKAERERAYARLAVLQAMLEAKGRGGVLRREGAYRARVLARFSRSG